MRTNILVFVALRQDEQQVLANLHRAPALRTRQQGSLESFESSFSLLWHGIGKDKSE
jgi:hypothetical protein